MGFNITSTIIATTSLQSKHQSSFCSSKARCTTVRLTPRIRMFRRGAQSICNRALLAKVSVKQSAFTLNSQLVCNRAASTVIPFKLADIGEGIAEVELLKWFVKEGDKINTFDRVCEVQSDKATVEITSRYDGVISKVYHQEGDIVKVGSTLIDISAEGSVATPTATPAPAKAPAAAPAHKFPIPVGGDDTLIPFKLADIGEGIAEVEILQWFVKEGDEIKAFDKVCEVQSDKATVEITSRFGGTVARVYSSKGDIVKVGSTLIDIKAAGGASIPSAPSSPAQPSPVSASAPASAAAASAHTEVSRNAGIPQGSKILTTPAVRKIAKENGLDLSRVRGTGPKGRILKEDVLGFLSGKQQQQQQPTSQATTAAPVSAAPSSAPSTTSTTSTTFAGGVGLKGDQRVPIRGIQRLMVKSMTESLQIPHLTYCEEVTFDRMRQLRESLKADLGRRGIKLSYMPFLIKAASLALHHYPVLNASITENGTEMIYHSNHNIGIAMDTPKGLIVPVIRQVQHKSVLDIAVELGALQEAAAKGTLTEAQLTGGTFSLSNIGSVGGTYAAPVVVLPQVAIGALGRLQMVPRYVNKRGEPADFETIESGDAVVAPTTIMNVSWSADHRVVEGATMARFSNKFKQYIENPQLMVTEMR